MTETIAANERELLLGHLATFEKLVETQRERFKLSKRCLAETQAAVESSKTAPRTTMKLQALSDAISNAVQGTVDALAGLDSMIVDLEGLRYQLSSTESQK